MGSIRVQRLEKELLKLISNVLSFKMRDKRLHFVTVTQVKLSPDFSHCKIFFSHMSDYSHEVVLKALIKSSGFIKREIASMKFMRIIPEITFVFDKESEKVRRLDDIFAKINSESSSTNPTNPTESTEPAESAGPARSMEEDNISHKES